MSDYRRRFRAGGTYFFTVVTYNRLKIFADARARACLHHAMTETRALHPFETLGIVLLPDHCHCIWRMAEGDADFSLRWAAIKANFTRLWLASDTHNGAMYRTRSHDVPMSVSRCRRGERNVWQRRFWEHLIRDQDDFARHMNYIHYNPVKHGYAQCPHAWEHSSFHRWVQEGVYRPDWHCECHRPCVAPDFEAITQTVGE